MQGFAKWGRVGHNRAEILGITIRFRLLRLMDGIGIKAKVLGGFFSSKGLLTGNVVEIVPMKNRKNIKTIAIFLSFEYTICNRVARGLLDIGDQAELCAQLFYIEHFEKSMVYAKTIGKKSSDNESTVNKI